MRHKLLSLTLFIVALIGCAPDLSVESTPNPVTYPDLGPASELTNDTWLNTNSVLRLSDLRGKVVIIDMWTYG